MAQLKFGSAGVTTREIDLSGPVTTQPTGIPAGIVGTAKNGPAFVPVTVGNLTDWYAKFGETDGKKFGPLAVVEWLRYATSVSYLRVLGVGDGKKRDADTGEVNSAGFVVGENQPDSTGRLASSSYANTQGVPGRTYFLGCFMSESAGSTIFSTAGLQGAGVGLPDAKSAAPIIRGVLMAASGVTLRLSSSVATSNDIPTSTAVATAAGGEGSVLGDVILRQNNISKQDFTLFLNGHMGTDVSYPNLMTASFDVTSNSYLSRVLNTDPLKLQQAGHYLYAHWDIHPSLAVVTGSSVIADAYAASASGLAVETVAFLVTSSLGRNVGSTSVPNYESFVDRFTHAKTPWFTSQRFGGASTDLFRLHALDAGAGPSTQIKVSIENIVPSTDPLNKYGSFTVVLREWTDSDRFKKPIANETFSGVNLDPTSDRYIAKVIGDLHAYYDFDREESSQKVVVEGNYENRSNYVRVEVHPDVENGFVDPTALPVGFRGIDHLVTSGSKPLSELSSTAAAQLAGTVDASFLKKSVTPPVPFREKITINSRWDTKESVDTQFYWGIQFEHPESVAKQNASNLFNKSMNAYASYFPSFSKNANFITGSNAGQAISSDLGVLDCDKFCNNGFSLENIQVVTNSLGVADPTMWKFAVYSRNQKFGIYSSEINAIDNTIDSAKLRALKVEDFASNKSFIKYTTVLQGGFDGVNIFDTDESEINNNAVYADMVSSNGRGTNNGPNVKAYLKALDIMKNVVNLDIKLLAIPGIREPIVTDAATLAVQDRFDAMYIMDIEQKDENDEYVKDSDDQKISVTNTVNTFKNRSTDSSFAAAYFPDVLYRDPIGVNLKAPPSVAVLGALALNDFVGHPWFAPAGYTRGALPDVVLEADVHLSKNDMDLMYDNRINPLVSFGSNTAARGGTNPRGGLVVWGQKTLQVAASALDRVNVRRLLIEIRRQVRDVAQTILFEPNRETTLARFSAAVTPNLQRIQALSGLERFKVIIDSSTTTQDDIENNTIRGKIFVQPTKSIEFVSLDFVVANNLQQVG